MNELVKIENNKIVVSEDTIKKINKFQKMKLQMDLMQEQLKQEMLNMMEQTGEKKYVSPDGTLIVNYFEERIGTRFDSKTFKEEEPELYKKYEKESITKAFVKITNK